MKPKSFDTIVIGLGVMGASALYALSEKWGNKVLGIDQGTPPHNLGSSHGDSRIFRRAIAEGPNQYTHLALQAYEAWRALETQVDQELLSHKAGGLILQTSTKNPLKMHKYVEQSIYAAQTWGIDYRVLGTAELKKYYPLFHFEGEGLAYHEPTMGVLKPENCVEAFLKIATSNGAQMATNQQVKNIKFQGNGLHLITTHQGNAYKAEHVVIAAGPWVADMLEGSPEYQQLFQVRQQSLLYYLPYPGRRRDFQVENFSPFIWFTDEGEVYGCPAMSEIQGVKIGSHYEGLVTHPDQASRAVLASELDSMYERFVKKHLPGLQKKDSYGKTCFYTMTTDEHFLIDTHKDYPDILNVSPCSGHGFKYAPVIGQSVASWVRTGCLPDWCKPFGWQRLLTN
jgi:sarcosine oxidase